MGAPPCSVPNVRSGSETLGGPQARTPSAWIGSDLFQGGRQRRPADEAQPRVPAAHADRHFGGTDTATPLGGEEAFDDAVLQGVVAEDDEAAAGPEEVDRGGEPRLESIEFLIDRDAQGLEDPG